MLYWETQKNKNLDLSCNIHPKIPFNCLKKLIFKLCESNLVAVTEKDRLSSHLSTFFDNVTIKLTIICVRRIGERIGREATVLE